MGLADVINLVNDQRYMSCTLMLHELYFICENRVPTFTKPEPFTGRLIFIHHYSEIVRHEIKIL